MHQYETLAEFLQKHAEIILRNLGLEPRLKPGGYNFLCPECGKRECFFKPSPKGTHARCNRRNKCGYSQSIFELVRERFSLTSNREVWQKIYALAEVSANSSLIPVSRVTSDEKTDWGEKFATYHKASKERIVEWLTQLRGYSEQFAQSLLVFCHLVRETRNAILFPIFAYDKQDKVIGYQIVLKDGIKLTNKGGSNKGILAFLVDETGAIIIVESVVNALLLARFGFNAICIFSANFTNELAKLMARYPGRKFYLWLDRGVEDIQEQAIQKNPSVRGILFEQEKKDGYDVDDLFKEVGEERFADEVRRYLRKADKPRNQEEYEQERRKQFIFDDLKEAIKFIWVSKRKTWLLSAPCGSGKTTMCLFLAVERLRLGKHFVYVANQKKDMYQFLEGLRGLLTPEEFARQVVVISREEQSIVDEQKIIVTHKTYFTRKGHSTLHYSILLWVAGLKKANGEPLHDIWVVIDEIQAYIRAQRIVVEDGGRYAKIMFKGKKSPHTEYMTECRSFAGRGSCEECKLSRSIYLYTNRHGVSTFSPYLPGKTGTDYPKFESDIENGPATTYNTLTVEKILQQSPNGLTSICAREYFRKRIYRSEMDEGQEETEQEILDDLIESSHNPLTFTNTPIDKESRDNVDPTTITKDNKKDYIFPKYTCQVRRHVFNDRSSLSLLYNGEQVTKLIFMGGTIRQPDMEFLLSCTDVEKIEITEAKRKLKKVIIVMFNQELQIFSDNKGKTVVEIDPFLKHLKPGEKILVFCPTERKTERLFSKFPRDYPVCRILGEETYNTEKTDTEESAKVALTHSSGPLGRAENRHNDMGCIVDGGIFLPVFALSRCKEKEISKETISQAIVETSTDESYQNLSRIIRINEQNPDALKFVIIHNADHVDKEFILRETAKVVEHLEFWHVKESQQYLISGLTQYLATGQLPAESEADYIAREKAQKRLNQMDKDARPTGEGKKLYDQAREEEKARIRIETRIKKGKQLRLQMKSEREIYRLLSLERLSVEEREYILKELGFRS